jgi:hypothetical protein
MHLFFFMSISVNSLLGNTQHMQLPSCFSSRLLNRRVWSCGPRLNFLHWLHGLHRSSLRPQDNESDCDSKHCKYKCHEAKEDQRLIFRHKRRKSESTDDLMQKVVSRHENCNIVIHYRLNFRPSLSSIIYFCHLRSLSHTFYSLKVFNSLVIPSSLDRDSPRVRVWE